jgi:transcription initiation factor TFIID subunit 9B
VWPSSFVGSHFIHFTQLTIAMAVDSQKQPVQPRDARIVSLILQSLGVEDYDPKVVHQLLEFAHSKASNL